MPKKGADSVRVVRVVGFGDRQTYEQWAVGDLTPHPANPNRGDIAAIQESIQRNDWYGAVIVQKSTGRILAGEHRWKAAVQEGAETIPVLVRDCDDVVALRILLADNETARRAEIDPEAVRAVVDELRELAGEELDDALVGTGLTGADLEQYEQELEAQDEGEGAGGGADDDELLDPGDDDQFGKQHGVLVVCEDEEQQRAVYESMVAEYEGMSVRCLSL